MAIEISMRILFDLRENEVLPGSRQSTRAAARSVLMYWLVKALGMSSNGPLFDALRGF